MTTLWILFILGQTINAGNMNYQQEIGDYEINAPIYGKHPSKVKVYKIKALECVGVYGATKIFPKHEKTIVSFAGGFTWSIIYFDYNDQRNRGIEFKYKW